MEGWAGGLGPSVPPTPLHSADPNYEVKRIDYLAMNLY